MADNLNESSPIYSGSNEFTSEAETVRRDSAKLDGIDETAQQIRDNLTELVAQRDELLAACKEIASSNGFADGTFIAELQGIAQAAIARTEGKKAEGLEGKNVEIAKGPS